ncbi:DUF1343 domain-containing protein [Enterococcus asini]|uniref:exo-beta-N-acetylmuramidase NamZ family protein n=1 Tax=Enterococcus asini TaxID=57732 RepID=UPI002891B73E|nr:DUF1343 domain-containing protein [Enterococcus asini]MDT2757664.1 DUF1343 domain-containing protein [Enterococcus asini]
MANLLLGIENLEVYVPLIKGKRVGLITNFTGVTSTFEKNYELLANWCHVEKLFTPEHGLHGVAEAGETVASYYDEQLAMNIVSLYGERHAPLKSDVVDLDVLLFDIQDIGIRYYTYIYTMYESMKVAKEAGIPFIVMDRPLPLGRKYPLGKTLTPAFFSFVGLLPLPNSYSLTIGELANWIQAKKMPSLALTVVPLKNWDSQADIVQNGLPWLAPSPNLPTLNAVRLYLGLCFMEGTNVSEGRGTVYPFEQIGAPWIDGSALAKTLAKKVSPKDCLFQPTWFVPLSSKHTGTVCQGVHFHLMNPEFNTLKLGYLVLETLKDLYPEEFDYSLVSKDIGVAHKFIEYLAGTQLADSVDFEKIATDYGNENEVFEQQVAQYYLY